MDLETALLTIGPVVVIAVYHYMSVRRKNLMNKKKDQDGRF